MAEMTPETLKRIIQEVYGSEIPDERLRVISRTVTKTLEALDKASEVDLEGLEPGSTR